MMEVFGICGYLSTIIIIIIIVVVLLNELLIHNEKKRSNKELEEPLYKESRTWTTSFLMFFQILLLCVIMGMITSILILVVGIDEHKCSSVPFYITTSFKFIGFALSFYILKQIRKSLKILGKVSSSRKRLLGCIFFSLSQSISGFYHCCYYGVTKGDGFSIVLILYFVFSALLLLLSSIYYIKIDNNDLFEWKTFSFSTENESHSINNNSISDIENSVDVKSLWRARKKNEKTKRDNSIDIFSKFSFSSATSSELSINVEKADLENYKVRAFTETNQKPTSPSLGGLLNFWNTRKMLGSESGLPSSSLFVIEWGIGTLNGSNFIHYKIGLGETMSSIVDSKRTVKILSKRYDELVFLREKLLIEFPAAGIDPMPVIPVTTNNDDDISSEQYDKHRDEMNAFFEKLITNPVCGRTVCMNLKANKDDAPDVAYSPISPSRKIIGSISELSDHVDPLLPLLPFDNRLINIHVVGWLKVDNKVFYDIEIKSSSNSWHVRKKFGQFSALHNALLSTWELPGRIDCPVKNTIKEKSNERDNEIKFNENTLALDAFIKKLSGLNPLPCIVLAFLESDVTSRSNGYDIIKDLSGEFQTQKTTLDQLSKRKERAHKIEQYFKLTKLKPLNTISSILPITSNNDNDDNDNDNNDDNDESDMDTRDSIFTTRKTAFFSKSLSKSSKLAPSKLLALPATLINEIIKLLKYLKIDKIQSKTFTEQRSDHVGAGGFSVIDSNATSNNNTTTTTDASSGFWIMQWRLNQIILSTTAFHDILTRIEALKDLNLNNLKDLNLSDEDIVSFLINLYNLMMLHASIVTTWSKDKNDLIKKKHDIKYKFASGSISLIQIEYYLLYSKCSGISFNYPTFLPSTEYTLPSKKINELFGSLQITKSNPMWYFLLGQPYKSAAIVPGVLYPDNLTSTASAALSEYLKRNVLINQKSVILPKILRLLCSGLIIDNDDSSSDGIIMSEESEINTLIESLEDKMNPDKPRGLSLSDWDRAEIIGGGTGIDDEELIKRMNEIPLGAIIKESEGNFLISESQLIKLKNILLVGVESRDRTSMFGITKGYSNCFVGGEAIRAMIASGQASNKDEGVACCNFLIEYGYISHVTKEHWMMDEDHIYFNYLPFNEKALLACITRLLIKYYQQDTTNSSTTTKYLQLMKGLRSKSNIHYGIENYSFCYPLCHST